jgi:hypothetical protein
MASGEEHNCDTSEKEITVAKVQEGNKEHFSALKKKTFVFNSFKSTAQEDSSESEVDPR